MHYQSYSIRSPEIHAIIRSRPGALSEFAFLGEIASNFASAIECVGLSMHPSLLALDGELEAVDGPRKAKYRHVQHSRVIYHADRWTLYSAPAPHIVVQPNDDDSARVRRLSIADQGSAGPPTVLGVRPHVGSSPSAAPMAAAPGMSSSSSSESSGTCSDDSGIDASGSSMSRTRSSSVGTR